MKKRGVDLGIRPSKATWLGGSWKERFMPVSIHLQKPPVFSFRKNDPKKGYFRSQKSHCWGSFVSRLALSENNVPQESNCILPVIPARGGAEVALGVYKTFLIYRPCMRRAPAKPVCACILRKWCPVSHVTCEAPLRTSHFSLHSSHYTLHTPHFTLHTALFALRTSLHTPHFTLHSPHFTLLTSHCFLHTPHFTLHSSRPTLHTALFTLHTSSHLRSSHLIPAHLFSSHLFSYVI